MIKLILFALVFTIVAHCEVVDLFTQPDFKGDRHQIDLTPQCNDYGCTIKCFALPGHMENNVESINTHDGCIRLYAGKHCVGDVVVVGDGHPASCTPHSNINECGWGNRGASIRLCNGEIAGTK